MTSEPSSPLRLALFMTRGMSLAGWDRAGLLARELALYRCLAADGIEVGIVSHGGPDEESILGHERGICVLANRGRLPATLYGRLVPWLHAGWLRRAHVIKTNQIDGSLLALQSARLWHRPLLARCGYLWSEFRARQEGVASPGARRALAVEARLFGAADRIAVTTRAMAEDVARRLPGAAARTVVLPNHVDTEAFRPRRGVAPDIDVLFVGRLADQKNLAALIEAVAPLDATLTIVGDGPRRDLVEAARERLQGRFRWHACVPHEQLPALMARARVFALPSLWEGHPKALIEAMAAGLAVIGADVPGIREVIRHAETGWLCGTGPEVIGAAVTHLLARPDLRRTLGANARIDAVEAYALDRIVGRELSLLREMAGARASA